MLQVSEQAVKKLQCRCGPTFYRIRLQDGQLHAGKKRELNPGDTIIQPLDDVQIVMDKETAEYLNDYVLDVLNEYELVLINIDGTVIVPQSL